MNGQRVMLLAGWMFLDLMLVIFLTQLGSTPAAPPTTVVLPTATAPSVPPGLDPASETIRFAGNADRLITGDLRAQRELINQVAAAAQRFAGRRAAMVLVFGTYRPCRGCPAATGRSATYSAAVIPLFHQGAPQLFPAESNFYRNYIDLQPEAGAISAEVFFYAR
ncbi:MAG: hypothetical protein ACRDUV_00635 [Pseudonocardiaceae bacterium]